MTGEANRAAHAQCRFQQAIGNLLRYHVVGADDEPQRTRGRAVIDGLEQVLSQPEDLVGVAVDELPHLRRDQRAPGFREQFLAQPLFQRAQLGADRGGGERQLSHARARLPVRTTDQK